MIRKDTALSRMQAAKGRPAFLQCFVDMAVYTLTLIGMLLILLLIGLCILGNKLPFVSVLLAAIPVVILAAAMSYFIFTLVRDLISGVLLQFFAGGVLCFVSGCLYPPYFFPAAVQKATIYLPTGAARSYLCGGSALLILGYSLVFFLLGSSIYCYRIRRVKA